MGVSISPDVEDITLWDAVHGPLALDELLKPEFHRPEDTGYLGAEIVPIRCRVSFTDHDLDIPTLRKAN